MVIQTLVVFCNIQLVDASRRCRHTVLTLNLIHLQGITRKYKHVSLWVIAGTQRRVCFLNLLFHAPEPEDIRTHFTVPVHVYVWLQTALLGLKTTERTVLLRICHTKEGLWLSVQLDHNNAGNSKSKGESITKGRSNNV